MQQLVPRQQSPPNAWELDLVGIALLYLRKYKVGGTVVLGAGKSLKVRVSGTHGNQLESGHYS